MYYRKIEGEKIYLSPMDKNNEIPLLTKCFNEDEAIAYNNGFISSISNEENISETVDKWNESGMIFSIINKETDEFMGHVSFFGADNNKTFITMGIYIAEEYRGNGYGLEAIKLSTEYMFRFHVYRSIHLEVFSYNEGAYRLYQKAGFKECGRFHNSRYFNGKFYDIILMEMLKN